MMETEPVSVITMSSAVSRFVSMHWDKAKLYLTETMLSENGNNHVFLHTGNVQRKGFIVILSHCYEYLKAHPV